MSWCNLWSKMKESIGSVVFSSGTGTVDYCTTFSKGSDPTLVFERMQSEINVHVCELDRLDRDPKLMGSQKRNLSHE
jgi:hypothetical protein